MVVAQRLSQPLGLGGLGYQGSSYNLAVSRPDALSLSCSSALIGVAGLHVLWGMGSAWPAADRSRLADAVAGTVEMPAAEACFGVAVALAAAAALVAGAGVQYRLLRVARAGIGAGLVSRGVMGVTGRTVLLVPWTPSRQFCDLDRRFYGPFCLALGGSILTSSSVSSRS